MPPVVPLIVAGAVFVAGARWVSRQLARKAEAERAAAREFRRSAEDGRAPRDLGPLEFDPVSQVYRPRDARSV